MVKCFLESVKCTKSLNYIKIGVPDVYTRLWTYNRITADKTIFKRL